MSHAFSKIISRLGENWCNWLRRSHWCKMTRTIVAWIFLCISCFRLFHSLWRYVWWYVSLINDILNTFFFTKNHSHCILHTYVRVAYTYTYAPSISTRFNGLISLLQPFHYASAKEAKLRLYLIFWFLFEETRIYLSIVVINFILITVVICM